MRFTNYKNLLLYEQTFMLFPTEMGLVLERLRCHKKEVLSMICRSYRFQALAKSDQNLAKESGRKIVWIDESKMLYWEVRAADSMPKEPPTLKSSHI